MTTDKKALLNHLEKIVDRHIQNSVQIFQNLSEQDLNKAGANGGWSIAQCLEHLNRYGNYYLPLISAKVAQSTSPNHGGIFKSGLLGGYFTRMMDPDASNKKIKAFKAYVPPSTLNGAEVVAEFIRQQEQLLSCLRSAHSVDLMKPRIPVSIMKFVKLRLGDVMQFVIMHNERHVRQALRTLN